MGDKDKQKTTNFTLRLPEEYRKRLQLQADKKGISVKLVVFCLSLSPIYLSIV